MRISINWIKDYVDLSGIETSELIKRFNLATAEIEDVYNMGEKTNKVVLARILEVVNHPNSNHLHILKVDDGSPEPVQVVCGAPNVRVGMVTAFAQVGGMVNGFKIGKAKLVGVESFGMCCSETELGIGSDNSGIMDIATDLPMGTSIKDVYPIDDVVFEIDNKSLTNRPDLWGHYGIAREFAAIFNRQLKPLDLDDLSKYDGLKPININVESKNCYRYSAITVDNVNEKRSPMYMKIRLNYCGMRDINLLADMTNYLMLELGQPMHAFDNAIVKGINVIEPNTEIDMETLEHETHTIAPNTVVICDENREPVAIAGIKGGLKSGITDNTNSLLLESAVFDAVAIRKAVKRIGLTTDASVRYEKSLDPETTPVAIARLLHILKNIDGGIKVTSKLSDVYNFHYPKHEIKVTYDFLNRRSGVELPHEQVNSILKSLGFDINTTDTEIDVKAPSWRGTKDVSIKEDLVEEVLRMYGYDNIVPQSMKFDLVPVEQIKEHTLEYKVKRLLAEKYGVSEVHSHIWNFKDFNIAHHIESKVYLSLMDSSNSGQSGIRSQLAPTLLRFVDDNKNNFEDVRMCEIGRVVSGLDDNNLAIENHILSIALASTTKSEKDLYFELKTMLENICESLVNTSVKYTGSATSNYYHPVNSTGITLLDGTVIGEMGIAHPQVRQSICPKHNLVILELDFEKLCNAEENKYERAKVSKYQSVDLDFTFVVPNDVTYARLEEIISTYKTKLMMEYSLKDIYENKLLLKDAKSYTFNFVINSMDRTLESKDIEKFSNNLIKHFEENGINLKK
ncbi:MAG TPA: phenylalanine--tRNA ligase subunit beta [Clostridiales bacterium]|nr:phenylalanine--tRNA ligase subunit beta [Clostridiales bacterium]